MSSAGHILDMINRIKQNKTLRKRKKFKEANWDTRYSEKLDTPTAYNFPEVSDAELEQIKIRIRRVAKASDRKSLYILGVVIIITAVAFWAFIRYYSVSSFMTH